MAPPCTSGQTNRLPVGIIGAGAAGLAVAIKLQQYQVDFFVLDQHSSAGGLWRTPFESPMYVGLRTNLPAGLMAFRNRPFGNHVEMKPAADVIQEYLEGVYREAFGKKNVTDKLSSRQDFVFSTKVVSTEFQDGRWLVNTFDVSKKTKGRRFEFRALVVCTGHYNLPNVPVLNGAETFPCQIIHSQQFRSASLYTGKTVLVVGGMSSGGDMANMLLDHGCAVHISLRKKGDGGTFHEAPSLVTNMLQSKATSAGAIYHSGIRELLSDGTVRFEDGTTVKVDTIVLATGYLYSFPFLPKEIEQRLLSSQKNNDPTDGWLVRGLFKRVWYPLLNENNADAANSPRDESAALSFVGLPNGLLSPWILCEFQANWIARVHAGVVSLPSFPVMQEAVVQADQQIRGRDALWFGTGRYCNEVASLAYQNRWMGVPLCEGFWYGIWTFHAWEILKAALRQRSGGSRGDDKDYRSGSSFLLYFVAIAPVSVGISWWLKR